MNSPRKAPSLELITARSGAAVKDRVDFGPVFDAKLDTIIRAR
jgi:hypothetical protein